MLPPLYSPSSPAYSVTLKMKKGFAFVLVFFLSFCSNAQDKHLVDSLESLLSTAKEDTSKANILAQLSTALRNSDADKALAYGEQCLKLSEKINYKDGVPRA